MASVPTIPRQEVTALEKQIQSSQLYNRQLAVICQVNGLPSSGVKATLQNRIVTLIQDTVNVNDVSRFYQVRQSVANAIAQRSAPASKLPSQSYNSTPSRSPLSTQYAPTIPSYSPGASPFPPRLGVPAPTAPNCHLSGSSYSPAMAPLEFRSSPFYRVEAHVSTLRVCEVMSQHRHSISIPLNLSDHQALQLPLDDGSYRVMIFCAAEPSGIQDITFPHQAELKVNGQEIKANMRGLKSKPGSTRPVDITHALRLEQCHVNNVEFTYALTSKKFYLIVNVCKIAQVADLVSAVSNRLRIPKNAVVAELNKKAQDPDVVATSQVLSLKCPLSYMRLDVPCRSVNCIHIQCFDATSYLQLQEQGPQWACPICNKSAPFEKLAVDGYVKDILDNTAKDLESVVIEPNGRWRMKASDDDQANAVPGSSLDDEDLVEISEANVHGGRQVCSPKTATPRTWTPLSSGSASMPRGAATMSGKRPASAVIDLTEDSDDESQQPSRKRQSTAANEEGYNGLSGGFPPGDVGFP
ncbi:hypothetical protein L249_5322 [Ophiocordyceps polyrhachis-furcata BCC 54312]|uniref:SP-RING-type domain-containing protein n=1 Tax=Ophiocordyceps polyrhachis-furcata BCC 54312 TaxID=1330021 RepID=A0A367L8F0_9HYPO|nr:hypothetical protein L249_5322 [Ophiocordyceps polyrhachis-furcata BCC 54312]